MRPAFDYGAAVRVIRNVRNDGTFPGLPTGAPLIRRGSIGYVRDVGTFLQDQLVYTVHFLDADRLVGCRQEELLPADAPWQESRYEFRDKVMAGPALAVRGAVVVPAGARGEITRVWRDVPGGVVYEVLFDDRVLQVPESALEPATPTDARPIPEDRDDASNGIA